MEISILLTEKEILDLPNDYDLGEYVRKKYNTIRQSEDSLDTEYDNCVICGKQSPYTKKTDIFSRIGYVEGAGQGCFNPNKCDKI